MEIAYFPGCSLKTEGQNFERTALALLNLFGWEAKELQDWVCCGATFSLSSDSLMYQIAPMRNLIRVKESGCPRVLTLCAMCYNTLKRATLFLQEDAERPEAMNEFMYLEETKLKGDEVEVVHLLSILEEIGVDAIREKVKREANGLKIAPYYGCLLLRPKEVSIDTPNEPSIMERIFEAAGCESVYFPYKVECCASYQVVNQREIVQDRTRRIVDNARSNGADAIVVSCPLCDFNLDAVQVELKEKDKGFEPMPVLYFTQLLGMLLGLDSDVNDFSLHNIDPRPLLEEKGLL